MRCTRPCRAPKPPVRYGGTLGRPKTVRLRQLRGSGLGKSQRSAAMSAFLQYTVNGLTVGTFYALVALGYTIVYGIVRLINFAQGDLSTTGAFLGWTLLVTFGLQQLPLPLALVIAFVIPMLGTATVNLVILEVAYKPLFNKSLLAILISALACSLILSNGIEWVFGPRIEAYPP